jgi:hypothetical protein
MSSYVSVSTVLMHVAFEIGGERHLERVLGQGRGDDKRRTVHKCSK